MRRVGALALLLLAGCGGPKPRPLEDRIVDLELALSQLDQRLHEATAAPVGSGLAQRAPLPEPDPRADARVVDLEARVSALEAQVNLLAELLRQAEGRPLDARPTGPRRIGGEAPDARPGAGPRVTFIDAAPAGRAPPPAGQPVEVLAAGAGDALLVRGPAGLEKVVLAGVEAPLTAQGYATDAAARARHAARLSQGAVESDAAFERSRARLEALVQGGRVTLAYPPGGPSRRAGALVARVTVPGATPADPAVDLAEAMAREGLVLAGDGDAERRATLEAAEAEARAGGLGLFDAKRAR